MYGCGKDCLILIPFRMPQISCFTLSLKCFSSDSDNFPDMGIGSLLQFPHLMRAGPVLLTLLFFPLVPSSYRVLRGSVYSFPLVRYSCPFSASVLNALLGLKVYSWGIHGERYTPHPPTPPPSCSLHYFLLIKLFSLCHWVKNISKLGVLGHPEGRDFPQILSVSAGPVACNSAYFVQTELALPAPKLGHACKVRI